MNELLVVLLKSLLLLSSLYVYNNQLKSPTEQEVIVEEAQANATLVYITNRYYQRVITSTEGLRIIERIGTDNEKWIFNADGTIQNIGTGLFLSGYSFDNAILLELTNKDSASTWSLEDNFLVHSPSGQVLSAHKDGSMYLAPRTAGLRSLQQLDRIFDQSLGVVAKLLALFDYLKDLKFEAQQWKLTTVSGISCPELGAELSSLDRGETFSHFRADTECLESIEPVMRVFTNQQPQGCLLTTGLELSLNATTNYYDIGHCSQVFAGKNNVVYLVHGFFPVGWLGVDSTSWIKASWFYDIKDRILEDNINDNSTAVIIVDWTKGSEVHFGLFLKDVLEGVIGKLTNTMTGFAPIISQVVKSITSLGPYHQASANTRYTGAAIARVSHNIRQINSGAEFHCVGHSLGSHTCGFAGKNFAKLGMTMSRITGLDPAGPLFLKDFFGGRNHYDVTEARLYTGDASFVDAIHTDATLYGAIAPVGHVDFYPGNAGKYGLAQPQYDFFQDLSGWSHNHAIKLFEVTVNNSCNAWKVCSNVSVGECEYVSEESQPRMGYHLSRDTAHGEYSLVAYKEYPYCNQELAPTSAGSLVDCFKKAKDPLFFPNLCVQGKMTSVVVEDLAIYCRSNYESANCGNLLGNKEQTISLYNLCLEEMFQNKEFQEAGNLGLTATAVDACNLYNP